MSITKMIEASTDLSEHKMRSKRFTLVNPTFDLKEPTKVHGSRLGGAAFGDGPDNEVCKINLFCQWFLKARENLAALQTKQGIPVDKSVSFLQILCLMLMILGSVGMKLLSLVFEVKSIGLCLGLMIRFLLDKTLDICNEENTRNRILKLLLLLAEILTITFSTKLLYYTVVIPVGKIAASLVCKIVAITLFPLIKEIS